LAQCATRVTRQLVQTLNHLSTCTCSQEVNKAYGIKK
jgi:hypothetical protein